MRITKIESPKNTKIKDFAELKDRRGRKLHNMFLVDGERELKAALACGFSPEFILVEESHRSDIEDLISVARRCGVKEFFIISKRCSEKLSVRENPSGVYGVFRYPPSKDLTSVRVDDSAVCICLMGLQKPGNIGAIMRTADAFHVDVVVVSKDVDIFSPNVIRNSVGTVFNLNILQLDLDEVLEFLKKFWIVAADPSGQELIWDTKPRFPAAIIFGSEDRGIPREFVSISHQRVRIPMFGIGDSLNVSVAAGIILYEIKRKLLKRDS